MSTEKFLKRWAKNQPNPKQAYEKQMALMPVTMEALRAMKLPMDLRS
ncbi:hypothetical protein FHS21_001320 [Phyllobacterium trifolii]|uniref:Uncharacterized protein n=1 Tax=Phyllobacterium trifolii TaxID=300193 RepID=A0A839U9J3_9HYPH|nr:hypothetical protein [Phyllobacterium trifolii]MBB3144919.1 hypothetical protein [Phyllobacterium trifolii]